MFNDKTVSAVLLIAGSSNRFSSNINKNLEKLNDKYVFMYSLDIFNNCDYIDNIFIVVKDSELSTVKSILEDFNSKKEVILVVGGNSRQESVFNAITLSTSDIVIVHDGARPMLKQEYIDSSLLALTDFPGTSIAVKSKDTIKLTDDNGVVTQSTPRENTWIIQTPQCFDRETLVDSHIKQKDVLGITDDCILLENLGHKVKLLLGDYTNIKITTGEDMNIITEIMKKVVRC